MPSVTMYTTAVCPFCVRAKQLLQSRGVAQVEEIRVDTDSAALAQMLQRTGRRTVPQIFIGSHHVGGYDDLATLDAQGKLLPMLQ